jgi:PAS domain S-box-containing protein
LITGKPVPPDSKIKQLPHRCGTPVADSSSAPLAEGPSNGVDLFPRENYRDIFDAVPDPIVIAHAADGRILLVNREFERASGYSKQEALGHTPIDLGLWPNPAECERCVQVLQSGGDIRNLHVTLRMKDGSEHPYLLSATSVLFQGQPCSMSVARDISELRKIEAELTSARDAAEAASRAKSEFLSSVSHEIRTPMNSILGMAELLAETQLSIEQAKYLALIRTNGNALLALINDVLDLARVERGRLQLERIPINLDSLLDGVIESLAVRANEKRLALLGSIDSNLARRRLGDPLRLRQILVNLIGNAIKFTERGHIKVRISPSPESDDVLHFAVSDTGIGIPASKFGQIFSSFSQADSSTARRYGGSGLGLAIATRLVALMGGQMWLESQEGAGSTFHFTACLPRQPVVETSDTSGCGRVENLRAFSAPLSVLPSGAATEPAAVRPLSILVVDDSLDNRYLLRAFLKRLPYSLTEAEDGRTALRLATSQQFDLILMDMQMPVMDGFAATRAIREWEKNEDQAPTPIIALTASALNEDISRCLAAGCDFHVSKPINKKGLLAAILRATGGGTNHPAAPTTPASAPH